MRKVLTIAGVLTTLIMSGCAGTMNIGEDSFACPGNVETGFKCMGVRDLYKATEGPSDSFGKKAQEKKAAEESPEAMKQARAIEEAAARRSDGYDPTPWMDKPQPIRSQAKVMRIWVAPFEDEVGDLNAPGMVFTEVEGRKWNVGEGLVKKPVRMSALNSPMGGASAGAAGGSTPFSVTSPSGKDVGMLKNVTPNADAKGKQPGAKQGAQKPQAGGQPPLMNVQ